MCKKKFNNFMTKEPYGKAMTKDALKLELKKLVG
jgi:hypothetical protein